MTEKNIDLRIGTWNLAGRWSDRHLALLRTLACDVLLLTEVARSTHLPGYDSHLARLEMVPGRAWAGVWTRRGATPLPDPQGASAMVEVAGLRICSSVLPWRNAGSGEPWVGRSTGERLGGATVDIRGASPHVWGGDWNQELVGSLHAGTVAGRRHIEATVAALGLAVPTADLQAQSGGSSIDHVAVPAGWTTLVEHHPATGLSDHDAYVVEARGVTISP